MDKMITSLEELTDAQAVTTAQRICEAIEASEHLSAAEAVFLATGQSCIIENIPQFMEDLRKRCEAILSKM